MRKKDTTNKKVDTIGKFIADKLAEGVESDMVKVALIVEHALSFNQAAAAFAKYAKENGMTAVRLGFTAQFYGWLETGTKSKEEAEKYIKEFGSVNSWRQRNHYINVMELSNKLHAKYSK